MAPVGKTAQKISQSSSFGDFDESWLREEREKKRDARVHNKGAVKVS